MQSAKLNGFLQWSEEIKTTLMRWQSTKLKDEVTEHQIKRLVSIIVKKEHYANF